MKKILLAAATIVASFNVLNAQESVKFGVQGGYLLGSSKFSGEGGVSYGTATSTSGFRVGVNATIPISSSLIFNPEINFINKGSKNELSEATLGISVNNSFNANYLEMPLNVLYKFPSQNQGGFFIGAGPSISMGLSGKGSYVASVMGATMSTNYAIKFDGKTDDQLPATDEDVHLQKFELGGNILAGYKLNNGLSFRLNYNFGFTDMDPNADAGTKNRYVGLTVGFTF